MSLVADLRRCIEVARGEPQTLSVVGAHILIAAADAEKIADALDRDARFVAALNRISQHPIVTPISGRPDLGLPPTPSCQEIARAALVGRREDPTS